MRALSAVAPIALVLAGAGTAEAAEAGLQRSVEWSWDWWILASLAVAALWYVAGITRLHRRLGPRRVIGRWEIASFTLGLGTIFLALESPIDSISDQLFSMHMLQHLLLMLIAAPLLVWGRPAVAFLWAFAPGGRKRIGRLWAILGLQSGTRAIMHPITVWLLYYTVFIAWHFPGPFQAALRDNAIHAAEHISFLVTALMFWTIVIEPSGRRRLGYGATFLFIATTAVLSAPPGALLALAQRPLYPAYADGAAAWGITQLEDQQLAGVVMWIPGGCVYLLAAAIVFFKWLEQPAPRSQQHPRLMRRAVLTVFVLVLAPLVLVGCDKRDTPAGQARFGDAARGRVAMQSFGCGTCHMIPGVLNANGLVGPPLIHFGNRIYIAGMLRNTPENMVTWLRNPQAIVPGNVMPDMGLSARDARDVAAYLFTLQ